MPDLHVFFTLGISPAILTETLWALTVAEGRTVRTVEIWTTEGGRKALQRQGHELREALHELRQIAPGRLPEPPASVALYQDNPDSDQRWILRALHADPSGKPGRADDVRDTDDLNRLLAVLQGRLREICSQDLAINAVLAGGRKTMSSLLQLAMSMQGRPKDRLLHVLLHTALDRRADNGGVIGREHGDQEVPYWFPTQAEAERYGVPIEEQVLLVDVPFPRLHPHVDAGDDWNEAWGRWLDAHFVLRWSGLHVCATRGDEARTIESISLTAQRATLLLALAIAPDGLDDHTLEAVIRSAKPPLAGRSSSTSAHALSQAVSRVNDQLSDELPMALRYLRIERTQSEDAASGYVLRGAVTVRIDEADDLTQRACIALRSVVDDAERTLG